MDSTAFASPYPQTPTPGGSANPNQPNRPPLTSLKPFGYTGPPKALIRKPHTPHPLAQVSMIDSLSTIANESHSNNRQPNGSHNNITLNQPRVHPDQSLEEDLRAFEQEQRNLQRRPIFSRTSRVSDDLTEDEDYDQDDDENSQSPQTTTIDDHDEMEDDSDFDRHSDSLRIGLSSLSPPGIGRASHHPGQLSTVTLDPEEDFTYQGGQDFSRDLSALSLSPIRRPSAPTPQRANAPANDHDLTMNDQRSEISQTPVSGFQGMARQLRHDFEQLTGAPTPTHHGRPQAKKGNTTAKQVTRGGTLKGGLSVNDGTRAKRVFGSDLDNGLKPPRLNQLHSAGLTSTPPAKSHATKPSQQDSKQQRGRNTLSDPKNHMLSRPHSNQLHQPSIRIVDATTDSNHPTGHDSYLAPAARKIVGNSVRVPDVTGLTDALRSPEKADFPLKGNAPSGARPNSESARPDPTLSEALTLLRRRLGSLETENEACQNLIRDLQSQLNHANQVIAMKGGQASQEHPDRSKATQKADMERMLQKIKIHTRRLTDSIQAHAIAIDELNAFKTRNKGVRQELLGVKSEVRQWSDEVEDMKSSLEGLTSEVREMRSMIERLVKTTSQSSSAINTHVSGPTQPGMSRRGIQMSKSSDPKAPLSKIQQPFKHRLPPVSAQQTTQSRGTRHDIEDWRSQTSTIQISGQSFIGPDEIQNLRKDVEQEQLLKLAAQAPLKARADPTNTNPSASSSRPPPAVKKPTLASSRAPPIRTSSAPIMKFGGTTEPAKVTDEVLRGEAILNSLPKGRHDDMSCSQCRLRRQKSGGSHTLSNRTSSAPVVSVPSRKKEETDEPLDEEENLPPQAVLVGILRDLEEDFEVHRKIFVELSETYRKMNPASIQVSKRKALAQHLRESVDTLEKKAGHIKHLYDLLHVKDLSGKAGSSRKI